MPTPRTRACSLCRNVLLLLAASLPAGGVALAADPPRPNIVLILADDLDELTTPYWDAMPQIAALLRDRGVRFSHAFTPTPTCCPSRASLLTGKYGHNTGVLTNQGDDGGWATFVANGQEQRTVAVSLQQAGYRTALFGKYMNGIEAAPTHVPPGWSDWHAFVDNQSYTGYGYAINHDGQVRSYGSEPAHYATDVVAAGAVDFVAAAEADDAQPFFLYVAPTAPHLPLPPALRHADHPYVSASAPRRANFNERDLSDKPAWLQDSGQQRTAMVRAFNDGDHRDRMGSLYALDDLVAGLVRALDAAGELDDTYLVFASDNGYNLGAHRLLHKMAPYEESARIPLAIAGPGIAARGDSDARLVVLSDLAPTFLDWAGVAIPGDIDGKSLRPLLANAAGTAWRSDFPLQYLSEAEAANVDAEMPDAMQDSPLTAFDVPSYRALRDQRHAFIEWRSAEGESPALEYELYDLQRDPFQLDNLLGTPQGEVEYAALAQSLKARMETLLECSGATCP